MVVGGTQGIEWMVSDLYTHRVVVLLELGPQDGGRGADGLAHHPVPLHDLGDELWGNGNVGGWGFQGLHFLYYKNRACRVHDFFHLEAQVPVVVVVPEEEGLDHARQRRVLLVIWVLVVLVLVVGRR